MLSATAASRQSLLIITDPALAGPFPVRVDRVALDAASQDAASFRGADVAPAGSARSDSRPVEWAAPTVPICASPCPEVIDQPKVQLRFDAQPSVKRHTVHEDSKRIGDELVLSLLWWEDEGPLIEIEEEQERRAYRRADSRNDD